MNKELVTKIIELLNKDEVSQKVKACSTKEEIYEALKPELSQCSVDDFYVALDEVKNQCVEFNDSELDGVDGGFLDFHYHAAK